VREYVTANLERDIGLTSCRSGGLSRTISRCCSSRPSSSRPPLRTVAGVHEAKQSSFDGRMAISEVALRLGSPTRATSRRYSETFVGTTPKRISACADGVSRSRSSGARRRQAGDRATVTRPRTAARAASPPTECGWAMLWIDEHLDHGGHPEQHQSSGPGQQPEHQQHGIDSSTLTAMYAATSAAAAELCTLRRTAFHGAIPVVELRHREFRRQWQPPGAAALPARYTGPGPKIDQAPQHRQCCVRSGPRKRLCSSTSPSMACIRVLTQLKIDEAPAARCSPISRSAAHPSAAAALRQAACRRTALP